jgi:hypothetical protein
MGRVDFDENNGWAAVANSPVFSYPAKTIDTSPGYGLYRARVMARIGGNVYDGSIYCWMWINGALVLGPERVTSGFPNEFNGPGDPGEQYTSWVTYSAPSRYLRDPSVEIQLQPQGNATWGVHDAAVDWEELRRRPLSMGSGG